MYALRQRALKELVKFFTKTEHQDFRKRSQEISKRKTNQENKITNFLIYISYVTNLGDYINLKRSASPQGLRAKTRVILIQIETHVYVFKDINNELRKLWDVLDVRASQ